MKALFSRFRYAAVTVIAAAFDQIIKRQIRGLPPGTVFWRLPRVLEITHYSNTGAAFSLFSGNSKWIALASSALLVLLAFYLLRHMRMGEYAKAALALLTGGGIGNLYDRLQFGAVTDYVRLLMLEFPVFNLADVFITLSVCYLAYELLTGKLDQLPGE